MAEMKIQGPAAIGIAAVIVLARLFTIGSSNDPALRDAVKAELANDLGGELGKALADQNGVRTAEALAKLVKLADSNLVTIYSTKVSKPLFSIGSTDSAIVKVKYSLPEQAVRKEYWRFSHGTLSGWRYRSRSSALSYFLNFI
ncbi:MAG: hypothetical protein ACSHXK_13560 [Oceanococcus sp.]